MTLTNRMFVVEIHRINTKNVAFLSVISLKASSLEEQFTCKVNVLFYVISEFLCRHNQETVLKSSCQCFGITS